MIETEAIIFSERDLLLGILWEGDHQIHTNKLGMKETPFGSTIAHGNTVTSKILGQFIRTQFGSNEEINVKEIRMSYLAPVRVGDSIKGIFEVEEQNIDLDATVEKCLAFEIIKDEQTPVCRGKMTIVVGKRK